MGSSESSKTPVSDIGVEETKKKMILENHQDCILKTKLKEIKIYYEIKDEDSDFAIKKKISDKGINDKDKWFINFIKKYNLEDKEMDDRDIFIYIIKNESKLAQLSKNLDYIYNDIPDDEKKDILYKFKLAYCWWFYQRIGSHRVLQFKFDCGECGTRKTIEMDKSTSGKNIGYENYDYNPPQWWHWKKTPYNWISYNFNDILEYYRNASNYYHGITNNCSDFAHEVYDKIKGKETYT